MGLMLYRRNPRIENFFSRDMNRLFEDFFQGFHGPQARAAGGEPAVTTSADWVPRVNVTETETSYKVVAELPGLEKEKLDVSIRENALVLKGERDLVHDEKEGELRRQEIFHGSFERVVGFPVEVDAEKVQASFKNGLLTVTIEKAVNETARPRKIQIV